VCDSSRLLPDLADSRMTDESATATVPRRVVSTSSGFRRRIGFDRLASLCRDDEFDWKRLDASRLDGAALLANRIDWRPHRGRRSG
jgi:hypothetical protein